MLVWKVIGRLVWTLLGASVGFVVSGVVIVLILDWIMNSSQDYGYGLIALIVPALAFLGLSVIAGAAFGLCYTPEKSKRTENRQQTPPGQQSESPPHPAEGERKAGRGTLLVIVAVLTVALGGRLLATHPWSPLKLGRAPASTATPGAIAGHGLIDPWGEGKSVNTRGLVRWSSSAKPCSDACVAPLHRRRIALTEDRNHERTT